MTLTTIDAAKQRADAARTRIFEATTGDPDWLRVARIQHNIVHCLIPASYLERWDAVRALEDLARDLEQNYQVK